MFELNIKSSKDITSLSINFADGTSNITSNIKAEKSHRDQKSNSDVHDYKPKGPKEKFLDTEADFSSVSQEIVALPKIEVLDRPIKVADELQKLDF